MGRMYSVIFENVAVTAAQDFFQITPADDKPIVIHAIYLSQSTEVGSYTAVFVDTKPIDRRTSVGCVTTSKPFTVADPLVGRNIVLRIRNAVVLPAPSGPTRPKISPRERARVRSSTAAPPSKRFVSPLASRTADMVSTNPVGHHFATELCPSAPVFVSNSASAGIPA